MAGAADNGDPPCGRAGLAAMDPNGDSLTYIARAPPADEAPCSRLTKTT